MKILVLGANGLLGTAIRQKVSAGKDRYIFSDITSPRGVDTLSLDIVNTDAVGLICASERVDLVVNCAAFTDLSGKGADTVLSSQVNAEAPARLAALCKDRGMTLLHLSTDYVFGGRFPGPLREDHPVQPQGVYGATKLQGEEAVLSSGCRALVLRTSWLYAPYGKNDMTLLLRQMAARPLLQLPYGRVGAPTCAGDVAAFIVGLITSRSLDRTGLFHYSAEGICSRYDFACALRDLSGSACRIVPGRERESDRNAPAFILLDKTRVKESFGVEIPHWYDALKKCFEESR